MKLEVFDPPMCCSTGVCGTGVDPALASFAGDLEWLAANGIPVRRYNLGQEPGVFAEQDRVRTLLQENGQESLPIVIADGKVHSTGRYPSRTELGTWTGLDSATTKPASTSVSTEVITELAAVGAAVGSNCEPCFKYHYNNARALGLSNEQLALAVRTAQMVKDAPATKMLDLCAKLLRVEVSALKPTAPVTTVTSKPPAATGAVEASCCGGGEPAQGVSEPIPIGAAPSGASCC